LPEEAVRERPEFLRRVTAPLIFYSVAERKEREAEAALAAQVKQKASPEMTSEEREAQKTQFLAEWKTQIGRFARPLGNVGEEFPKRVFALATEVFQAFLNGDKNRFSSSAKQFAYENRFLEEDLFIRAERNGEIRATGNHGWGRTGKRESPHLEAYEALVSVREALFSGMGQIGARACWARKDEQVNQDWQDPWYKNALADAVQIDALSRLKEIVNGRRISRDCSMNPRALFYHIAESRLGTPNGGKELWTIDLQSPVLGKLREVAPGCIRSDHFSSLDPDRLYRAMRGRENAPEGSLSGEAVASEFNRRSSLFSSLWRGLRSLFGFVTEGRAHEEEPRREQGPAPNADCTS
jgi:hypothetical protein